MSNFKEIFESRYTWNEGFMRNVRRYSKRTAMIDPATDRSWTYEELNGASNQLCNALLADGIQKKDVVMMQLFNCAEFAFAYLACHKLQTVCCPVNFRLSSGELAYIIDDSKPFVLLCCKATKVEVINAVKISRHKPKRVIVIDEPQDNDAIYYEDYVKAFSTDEPHIETPYNMYDETTRMYTSGTTGKPKAVGMTSINEVLTAHDGMIHYPLSYRDVTMNTTPWFHRGGLHCAGPCPTLYAGGTMIIMGKFDAIETLRYVYRYKITFIVGVPTVLEELTDQQIRQGYDLSALKGIVTMGSPLERSACIRYQTVLTPNIFNGYGTTETFVCNFLLPDDLPEHAGTVGKSCADDDVRVVKVYEDRRAEPDDFAATDGSEVGEVIICSPAKSPFAYYGREEETKAKFYKDFMYTGDLATWDEDQFVTVIGRKDDMIISSGENIYPTEIEEVLNLHPKVKDCIVTSVPDKVRGEIVTAYVLASDDSLTADELDEYCKKSNDIANFKRPRYYRFTTNIPHNPSGKKMHVKIKETALHDYKNGLLYRV